MAHPSSHRRPRKSRALLIAVAVGAVALIASVIVAFRPGGGSGGGSGEAVSVADGGGSATAGSRAVTGTSSAGPSPSATPTASASASPSKKATPKATAAKRPKTTSAPKSPVSGGSSAGRIKPGVTYTGIATFYDAGNGDGACTFGPTSDVMTAAMNHTDYETAKACGAYVRVRAADGASITVRVTNECPECKPGHIDLSAPAFAKLAAPVKGQIPITWSLLSPADAPAALSVRYKTGSSRYWCGIQVLGHRNPVARLEVRAGSGWTVLPRAEFNYFLSEGGAGCGAAIRITDIYGEQLTVEGIAVRPDAVQQTGVQFARH
ncbi:expansin EXLX1 family cellulose-binding protein [Streptomyces sp. NPDC051913]|uniref:expansin EXLX1 family cellulose-binding protein n=1 Tax=Streptomyces sp. NPDC051913 TaxID=3365676 RepID=UPI0037D0CBD5